MSDLRWWLGHARPYAGWLVLGAVLGVATLAANMALLAVAGWFLASMAAAGLAGADMNYFTPAALIRGLAIVRTVGRYLERLVTHDATLRLLTGLRLWFYQQVEPLAASQTADLRSGDLLARVGADIDTLDQVYLRLFLPVGVAALGVAGAVAVWALYSPAVAAANLLLLAVAGGVLPWLGQRAAAAPGAESVALAARLKAHLVDLVEGLGELTVCGALARREREIATLTAAHMRVQTRLSRVAGLTDAGLLFCTQLAVLASVVLIVPAIRAGTLGAVDFAPVVLLALDRFEAVAQLPGAWQALGGLRAATRRLRAFEAMPSAIVEPASPRPAPSDHHLQFERVFAAHEAGAPWALADVSLRVAPGERVAVIGASGAGKSTLLALLARLCPYQGGTIRWGAAALESYASHDLRAAIALVPQRVFLFNASVRDNIAIGCPDAGEAELVAAARAAALHDDIMALPAGYDTRVGDQGMRLSGGQMRRIGIARALLKNAPVVLMDEPDEGLDAATAARLWQGMAPFLAGRTLILVTHQPAWAARCERVLVFDRGRLVGDDTPAQLRRSCMAYRHLQGLDPDQPGTPHGPLVWS